MRTFLATLTFATLAAGTAFAGDPPASEGATTETTEAAPAAEAPAEAEAPPNCAELEGDAKTACEEKLKEAAAAQQATEAAAGDEGKGGKAQRSNTNRMEAEFTDE